MESNGDAVSAILHQIESLKAQKTVIDQQISSLEAQLHQLNYHSDDPASNEEVNSNSFHAPLLSDSDYDFGHGLSPDMIYRYSRQLILPSFGVQAQSKLLKSSVLVIGAGGLGSPALLYLSACGIGRIGIVDHDVVELNNLHRQIIHAESYIGRSKVESAATACRAINSTVEIVEHKESFRTTNALEIMRKYDIVIDATDNLPSRYMISDCCVVLGKPLVSGAALGLEGQLTVYNYNGGPCYRCLFPTPPPTSACQRCADSGVLGVVPGVIGCLQALEAIKVGSAVGDPLSERMLLFDALSGRIRTVKIRGRSLQCEACGENSTLTEEQFREMDYEIFTQTPLSTCYDEIRTMMQQLAASCTFPAPLKLNLLPVDARISSKEYREKVVKGEAHVLVDVRPAHHYKIVSLPKSINIPLSSLEARLPEISAALGNVDGNKVSDNGRSPSLYVVCRRGNDSQRAVQCLHKMGFASAKDIVGGIESWARDVDAKFPTY